MIARHVLDSIASKFRLYVGQVFANLSNHREAALISIMAGTVLPIYKCAKPKLESRHDIFTDLVYKYFAFLT